MAVARRRGGQFSWLAASASWCGVIRLKSQARSPQVTASGKRNRLKRGLFTAYFTRDGTAFDLHFGFSDGALVSPNGASYL